MFSLASLMRCCSLSIAFLLTGSWFILSASICSALRWKRWFLRICHLAPIAAIVRPEPGGSPFLWRYLDMNSCHVAGSSSLGGSVELAALLGGGIECEPSGLMIGVGWLGSSSSILPLPLPLSSDDDD